MMGMMGSCMAGLGLTGMLGLALLGGLVVGLVYLARSAGQGGQILTAGYGESADHALALLRERYARGEIDREDYEQRRGALSDQEWAR